MGDRGNVEIKSEDGSVFLYTHWYGSELPAIVRTALRRGQRWNDASYLARIVFDTMKGSDYKSETGFGIYPIKAEGLVVILNVPDQTVNLNGGKTVSFDEYCA